jgi:DNA polymerase
MSKKEEMKKIVTLVSNCKKCDLYKTRRNSVVGIGSLDSKILFIGEAPGYNEDLQGLPFVGRAGKILDELLKSIGLKKENVYIVNIIKCRPPKNRNPLKNEIVCCTDYLDKQIEIIHPVIIVPLGNFAVRYIFEKFGLKTDKISNIHGKIFDVKTVFNSLKIIPLYHPAVVTYNPKNMDILLEDFKKIKIIIQK